MNDSINGQTTDKISQFIDGIEEMFADIRERFIDDSVCGLCEYDGAYVGESGDWCNECPGFEKDDCFKLSDKTRKKWTEEIIKALPSAEPRWIAVDERVPEVGTYIVTGKQKYDWEYSWHYFVDVAYCPGNYIDNHWDTFNDWYEGQETHIIAWMPLPEPWKGEADE